MAYAALRLGFLCLIAAGPAAAYQYGEGADSPAPAVEEGSCDDVALMHPAVDRCSWVAAHCDSQSMLNYLALYYCHVAPHGVVAGAHMVVLCVALLALLFRVIGRTADDFFSCILSQISQDLGLPPRLGGVTLLALGNGAPDLSACIAAVKTGNYRMALGALTGACMFVGCVVAGRIISISGGVHARPAQVRDVLCLFLAVLVVTCFVAVGRFSYTAVATLISLYGGYVVVVAVADFTKRAGVDWPEVARGVSRRISSRFGRVQLGTPLLEGSGGGGRGGRHQRRGSGGAVAEDQLSDESEGEGEEGEAGDRPPPQQQQQEGVPAAPMFTVTQAPSPPKSPLHNQQQQQQQRAPKLAELGEHGSGSSCSFDGVVHPSRPHHAASGSGGAAVGPGPHPNYEELVHMPAQEYRRRALADMAQSRSFYHRRGQASGGSAAGSPTAPYSNSEDEEGFGWPPGRDEEQGSSYQPPTINGSSAPGGAPRLPGSQPSLGSGGALAHAGTIQQQQQPGQPPGGQQAADAEACTELGQWGRASEAVQQPFMLLLQATIPIVESNSYERRWFLASMACSPPFICLYLGLLSWRPLLLSLAVGAVLAGLAAVGTAGLGGKAPVWGLGTTYPFGAAVVALYGFAVAAMWIDKFAGEIVGLLHFLGLLARLDPAVLGITVLAWGNSLMDLINNTTMAARSQGGNSMAMTACYAGPLFNLLLGLGLGFWALLGSSGASVVRVEMEPPVLVGCLFVLVACLGTAAVALRSGHRLPAQWGWALVGWYCLYLAVVLLLLLWG